jgi:hypothetical protein
VDADRDAGVYVYRLRQPLAPGAVSELIYQLSFVNRGFENDESNTRIVEHGTFLDYDYLPSLGYSRGSELVDDEARRKHQLPPRERLLDLDDPAAPAHNYIAHDADRIRFEATVSTSPDQRVIAPGVLEKEWTEGNRRYFHYVEERPIFNFVTFISGRYVVERDSWNGIALEIAHHPSHTYDIPSMFRG